MLDSFGDYVNLTKNSYMILSELSPVEMRNDLRTLRKDARIFVAEVSSPAAWGNLICANFEIKDLFHS